MIGSTVLSITAHAVGSISKYQYGVSVILRTYVIVFHTVLPLTVLVINAIVLHKVRRAPKLAAANLGLQQHHELTSSNSAVPNVMLITTSFVYVLINVIFSVVGGAGTPNDT